MSAAGLPVLSPLVTRIIEVSGFSSDLKTRDVQAAFATWEDEKGGFKIKWVDDTSVLIIFADAATGRSFPFAQQKRANRPPLTPFRSALAAKKAYLNTLMSPPAALVDASGRRAQVRPYDGEDATTIIHSVHHRTRSRSNATNLAGSPGSPGHSTTGLPSTSSPSSSRHRHTGSNVSFSGSLPASGSISRATGTGFKPGHFRHPSGSNPSSLPAKPIAAALYDAANGGPSPAQHLANAAREQGVPLPPVPTSPVQGKGPTSSSASAATSGKAEDSETMEVMSAEADGRSDSPGSGAGRANGSGGAHRVGDAGKRLVAGALGVRHPALESKKGATSPSAESPDASVAAALPQGMEKLKIA
jgi:hypothetical protein